MITAVFRDSSGIQVHQRCEAVLFTEVNTMRKRLWHWLMGMFECPLQGITLSQLFTLVVLLQCCATKGPISGQEGGEGLEGGRGGGREGKGAGRNKVICNAA